METDCVYDGCTERATTLDRDDDHACATHAAESWKGVSWRDVPLLDGSGRASGKIDAKSPRGIEALREFRADGHVAGIFLADASTMEIAEGCGYETANLGPDLKAIDWTGFLAICAWCNDDATTTDSDGDPACELHAAQDAAYVVTARLDLIGSWLTSAQAQRATALLDAAGWDVTIREPRKGEAEGTHRMKSDGTLQILGFSIPVPEALAEAIRVAGEKAVAS